MKYYTAGETSELECYAIKLYNKQRGNKKKIGFKIAITTIQQQNKQTDSKMGKWEAPG